MKQVQSTKTDQEWLKVLSKGLITIPKVWRDQLGLDEGKVVKAEKVGNKVVIQAWGDSAPYRIFSDEEIKKWLKDDKLPPDLKAKVNKRIKSKSL